MILTMAGESKRSKTKKQPGSTSCGSSKTCACRRARFSRLQVREVRYRFCDRRGTFGSLFTFAALGQEKEQREEARNKDKERKERERERKDKIVIGSSANRALGAQQFASGLSHIAMDWRMSGAVLMQQQNKKHPSHNPSVNS